MALQEAASPIKAEGSDERAGLFFSLEDCKCLFRKFKKDESTLSDEEGVILLRVERMLYSRLSIQEINELSS